MGTSRVGSSSYVGASPGGLPEPVFAAVCDLVRGLSELPTLRARVALLARYPRGTMSLVRLLMTIPWMTVGSARDPLCPPLRRDLSHHVPGFTSRRVAQSVLVLPASMPEYLTGRSRQAVRTGVSRAERAHLTVSAIAFEDQLQTMTAIYARHAQQPLEPWLAEIALRIGTRLLAVTDPEGEPLTVALFRACPHATRLYALIGVHDRDDVDVSAARYLLHTAVVEQAIGVGSAILIVGSSINLSRGLQHWQKLLGYATFHLWTPPTLRRNSSRHALQRGRITRLKEPRATGKRRSAGICP